MPGKSIEIAVQRLYVHDFMDTALRAVHEHRNAVRVRRSDDFLYRLGLEYRYILLYLRGRFKDRDEFRAKLFMEIRHLAKEQMTWFRKRKDVHWLNMADDPFGQAVRLIDDFYGA